MTSTVRRGRREHGFGCACWWCNAGAEAMADQCCGTQGHVGGDEEALAEYRAKKAPGKKAAKKIARTAGK